MSTSCRESNFLVTKLTREVDRLGSTVARLKLKGIDGGPHKRWSMWFNSKQREEPYLGLKTSGPGAKSPFPARDRWLGAAWLSSARVVRCWVKSRNERNPCCQLPSGNAGHSGETAGDKPEEGGDDVKSSWPLCPGLHTCYNGRYKPLQASDGKPMGNSRSQFGVQAATRLHEAGIASNRGSARRGEYVPGPCTHRPSHHESRLYQKSVGEPARDAAA